jgi:hypothetical protein
MAVPFTNVSGSATVGVAEYSLPGNTIVGVPTQQNTALKRGTLIVDRVGSTLAGDTFNLVVYEKANGGAQHILFTFPLVGATTELDVFDLPSLGEGWEISLKRVAGADRVIGFSIREDVGDANAATAGATAVASIVAGLLAATVEGTVTVGRALRGIARFLLARRSGYDTGHVVIRDLANTKNSITIDVDATGYTTSTLNDLD